MTTYDLGDPVTLTLTVRDPDTDLPLTPTAVALVVHDPTGVEASHTPTSSGPGDYQHVLSPAMSGTYLYRWTTTGPGAGAQEGTFTVRTSLLTSTPAQTVSVADVQARFPRPLTAQEQSFAAALLVDAAAEVSSKVPSLDERIATGALSRALVVRVLCAMVLRVLRNPDGHRQGSRTIDDFSQSWTVDSALSSGALYLDPVELQMLLPPSSGPWAGSVRLGTPFL